MKKKPYARLVSWNVNGIRATYKKEALTWLFGKDPIVDEKEGDLFASTKNIDTSMVYDVDIFGFQETKAEPIQLPASLTAPQLYPSTIYSSCQTRKGYSGTSLYSKIKPIAMNEGFGVKEFDQEGRIVHAEYASCHVFNVYFPNGGGGPVRLDYKMRFYDAFLEKITKLSKKKPVIFFGDVNTAHTEIDLARPKENEKNTGFLPEERAWIDEVIRAGFVDIYRELHPRQKDVYTYWDMKTAARERNVGWRIDYFFIHESLRGAVDQAKILADIYGSDHCPIELTIERRIFGE